MVTDLDDSAVFKGSPWIPPAGLAGSARRTTGGTAGLGQDVGLSVWERGVPLVTWQIRVLCIINHHQPSSNLSMSIHGQSKSKPYALRIPGNRWRRRSCPSNRASRCPSHGEGARSPVDSLEELITTWWHELILTWFQPDSQRTYPFNSFYIRFTSQLRLLRGSADPKITYQVLKTCSC